MRRWKAFLLALSVVTTSCFSSISFADNKSALSTNFTLETLNKTTNLFIDKVKNFNEIYAEKKTLDTDIERNLELLASRYLDASKFSNFSLNPTFTEYSKNLKKWTSNLVLSKGFRLISNSNPFTLNQTFKQLDDSSYKDYASKSPVLSSERIKITEVEFPTKPTGQQVSYFRLFITSKYFVSNWKINVNFGGNFAGGGVGFNCCAIYPGTPIVVNTNPTQFNNMIASMSSVNDEYQYQVLVPLIVVDKSANLDVYFQMADTASFVVGDFSRNIYSCPWWFARNGSPTATNPNDPWIKSQIFAFFSNDVSCADSPNSKYVLWQDSFESNLLRQTNSGDFEVLLSAYREYSKYEQSVNLIPENLGDLSLLVNSLSADLKAQMALISEMSIFIEEAKAKAAAELKAKQDADAKAAAELKAKQDADAKAAAVKKTTITCVKGKLVKKVTAVKPVCPKGYKKK